MPKWDRLFHCGRPVQERGNARGVRQSDLICPKDFLQSWGLEALEAVRLKADVSDEDVKSSQIAKKMGVDHDTVKELSEVCGAKNLFCGDEPQPKKKLLLLKTVPHGVDLQCVNYQMKERQVRRENKNVKVAVTRHMKYSFLDDFWFMKHVDEKAPAAEPAEQVAVPNVVISVQVTKCRLHGIDEKKLPLSETFIVLGSQALSGLKDAILCPLNSVIAGDYSNLPDVDQSTLQRSGDLYKSGFFLIENVFYNDMRHPDNKDYSKQIMEWAKTDWPEPHLSTSDMAATKFSDLKLRLGHYYLFVHQGNCEHSVQFQDMRLFNTEDNQDATQYPIRIVQRIGSRKLCQGCTKLSARWIVFDSPLIPSDPCFLCQKCFKSLLYTPEGEKTSNFRAHHYSEYFMY